MHIVGKIIALLPSYWLRLNILKLLYRKNGLHLKEAYRLSTGHWLFCVDDTYIATESISWYIDYKHVYQTCLSTSLFGYVPKPGDTILDIGAGIGEEVVVFSRMVGEAGKVYCVEANPRVFRTLEEVIRKNKLTNVVALNCAIFERTDIIELEDDENSYLRGSLNVTDNKRKYKVQGVAMDELIEKIGVDEISLAKCNIEGAEKHFIAGLNRNFHRIKNFAISCHDFRTRRGDGSFYATKVTVTQFFQNKGIEVISQNTGVDYIDDWLYCSNTLNQ